MNLERPRLTQHEAVAACGVSHTTIRRYRTAGRFPNAVLDPVRGWLIPVEDLLGAGLRIGAPAPAPAEQPPDEQAGEQGERQGRAELLVELERERHRRELAEAEARHLRETVQRQDQHIADVRRAMLALTAGSPADVEPDPAGGGQGGQAAVPAQNALHGQPRTADDPGRAGPAPEPAPAPRGRWFRR